MKCNRIRLRDFRNIEKAEVEFKDGVNILVGENAQGKTNLLEAISFVSIGKSFWTSKDEEMIRFGAESFEVSLDYEDSQREQNITVRMMPKKRHIEQNKVKMRRVSDVVGQFRTVLFCPELLSLIKSGPGERRNYLDIANSQLYPLYLKSLQRYNQILKQRNKLIHDAEEDRTVFRDTIEFWSRELAVEAAKISRYRMRYIKRAQEKIADCFTEMTGERERPEAIFEGSAGLEPDAYEDLSAVEERYFQLLMNNHEREIGAGTTLWGIHRDDIDILLNGKSARSFASQGQQRSLVLAMKIAEGEVCKEICGEKPVFLFDDVFSELDPHRRAYLAGKMADRQVIMTTSELGNVSGGHRIEVVSGTYTPLEK